MKPGWTRGLVRLAAALLLPALIASAPARAADPVRLLLAPHDTDERLPADDPPHLVIHDPARADAPLLVWLPGTHGKPASGPQRFFETAVQQGYAVLGLAYDTDTAVGQVCAGARLRAMPDCAARMRQHRVWGEPQTRLIPDAPEAAIVPRLTRLLQHLARSDPAGPWAQALDGDEPRWSRIVLAGQSQGGGMAAFLAQTRAMAGVIVFSGGWDHRSRNGELADWYGRGSVTPPERWHAVFHVQEPQSDAMREVARRLGVPEAHIHALDQPVQGGNPHGEGIHNAAAYRPLWEAMLARP